MDSSVTGSAEERTALAEDRTLLANERTFAGWLRTSLATVGIGVGFQAIFSRIEPPWVPRAISTAFLLIGIVLILLAERRAAAVLARLNAHSVRAARLVNLRWITFAVILGIAALIGSIWFLDPN